MVKTVILIFLAGCFFLEDVTTLFSFNKLTVSCYADPVQEDSSETKEKDGEEKVDESKIHCELKAMFSAISMHDKNYLKGSKFYLQPISEITTPPPDFT